MTGLKAFADRTARKQASLLCAASALAMGLANPVSAQQAAPADAAGPSDTIAEVVVTAQRRPEYAKNVPLAVTSIQKEELTALGSAGDDIRFLAARVPSLQIESSFGRTYPRFYIRGLGNSDFDLNAAQPVSVLYDDVVLENPILKAFPIFDTAEVEVLRGPQGTLFGRNTPAGVVKIDSVKPSDDYKGFADVSYSTYNTVSITGAVGGAIVDNVLDFRASILEQRRDDWVHNTYAGTMYRRDLEGYNDVAGRFQLLFKPTDTLSALLDVHLRSEDGTARIFRANIIQKGTNDLVPGFKADEVSQDGDNYQRLNTQGAHLTINDDLGSVQLISVSAYEHGYVNSRGDIDGGYGAVYLPVMGPGFIPFTSETSDSIPNVDQITQEIRFVAAIDDRFTDQGGALFYHEYIHINDFDYTPDGVVDILGHQTQSTDSYGIFNSAQYKATDALTLNGGIRYSKDMKDYHANRIFGFTGPIYPATTANGDVITWNASASYAINNDMNVYGRVATGYLSPSIQGRILFGNDIFKAQAEKTISYEAGLKAALLDHRANLNLTAYTYTTKNIQLTAVGGNSPLTRLLNAQKAVGSGVESEFEFKPIPSVFLTTSASYNFTQIKDPTLEVGGCGGGCTVLNRQDPANPSNYFIDGNPLPQAPRWIVDWTARYDYALSDSQSLYVYTDWSYRSTVDFFLYKAVEFTGQPLLQGGLRVGYVDYDRNLDVAVFVRNILDEVKATGGIDFDNLTGFINDPRTAGVEAKYTF